MKVGNRILAKVIVGKLLGIIAIILISLGSLATVAILLTLIVKWIWNS